MGFNSGFKGLKSKHAFLIGTFPAVEKENGLGIQFLEN